MASSTLWDRVKGGSKKGFDAGWKALDKLGAPTNRLSNKLGSEAFWPTTLDKESEKAARILKSFCKDGFYQEDSQPSADGPKQKAKVLKKIPQKVIQNAKGLAIFTTMRTGLWVSGAGGSGVLVARQADGSWSPPSGILLHTAGLGFLIGIDIYDCVVVINSDAALEAFTKVRCTLGSEISVTAGPVGAGGVLDTEVHKRQAPIFTYMKSRGFYAGVQIDGTIVIERTDENERFYRERVPVADILAGKIRHPPTADYRRLTETLKAAQGDTSFDETALPTEPPPSDYLVENGHLFGVPEKDDPDPYGVLALEKEGFSLREAGTQKRASWEEFAFNPSASSPIHSVYARSSQDRSRRNSWRASALSSEPKTPSSLRNSMDMPARSSLMVDTSTQTDFPDAPSPRFSIPSHRSSRTSLIAQNAQSHMQEVPEDDVLETPVSELPSPEKMLSTSTQINGYTTPPGTPPGQHIQPAHDRALGADDDTHDHDIDGEHDDEHDEIHIEQPVVHSVQTIQTVQPSQAPAVTKARIVNVPKRIAPKLPPRNPNRAPRSIDTSLTESTSTRSRGTTPVSATNASVSDLGASASESTSTSIDEKMDEIKLETDEEAFEDAKDEKFNVPDVQTPARIPGGFD